MSDARVHTAAVMDTTVSIRVVHDDEPDAIDCAFTWFRHVEAACNRFDEDSELRRLCATSGVAVPVSDILFETVRFALALAEETGGAFDPTVGARMEARGFDRDYRSGRRVQSGIDAGASYRDVELDAGARTITLHRPLLLDLGAVAKGFAIDVAAQELRHLDDFAIDAGGDLYLGGVNERGEQWAVGVRHPRRDGEPIETLRVSNAAVCTSGDYLRAARAGEHHIVDPSTGHAAAALASATVVAPIAMVADGLATAAFVLGPADGLALLERHGAQGLLITPELEIFKTREF